MKTELIEKFITHKRLENYHSIDEYKKNLYLSEEYYILLSIFEVSLRNSIDNYLKIKISTNWLNNEILHSDTKQRVDEAKRKILQRKEFLTHDKMIAELPLGFWTSLFRSSYSNLFRIKDLKNIFPNLPSKEKNFINRNILDKRLNKIRKFRNRVFHYERIVNKTEYTNMKEEILKLISYFDEELYLFALEVIDNN